MHVFIMQLSTVFASNEEKVLVVVLLRGFQGMTGWTVISGSHEMQYLQFDSENRVHMFKMTCFVKSLLKWLIISWYVWTCLANFLRFFLRFCYIFRRSSYSGTKALYSGMTQVKYLLSRSFKEINIIVDLFCYDHFDCKTRENSLPLQYYKTLYFQP